MLILSTSACYQQQRSKYMPRPAKPELTPLPPVAPAAPQPPRQPRQRTQEEMLKLLSQIREVIPQMRHFRDDDNPAHVAEDMMAELLRGRELIESEKNAVM